MAQRSHILRTLVVTFVTLLPLASWGHSESTFPEPGSLRWSDIVQLYEGRLGERYQGGGKQPGGFDCSGLLYWVYGQMDQTLPASSRGYAQEGKKIARDSIRVGDFMLFSGRNASEIGHVGLCVGKDSTGIYMLHSATHSGVLIENWVGQAYYERRYLGARRLFYYRP